MLSRDTSPDAERIQIELWRAMSPLRKLGLVGAISRNVQQLSLTGIRERHPDATEDECLLRLAVLKLGSDLARRAYPGVAELTGC
jgi:hypothetical protein